MSDAGPCACASCCCFLITLFIYIIIAIGGIEPTQYGILKNNITQNVDDKHILGSGINWVGIFHSLIKFPSIHNNIEFSDEYQADATELKTRTAEGLELSVHCAFQYKLIKEDLVKLYRLTGGDYKNLY